MIEEYEKQLDCKNYLRDNLNIFIEAFITFYGEERRKEIEEKFSKAVFYAYRDPETTETILRRISELVSEEIWNDKIHDLDFKVLTKEDLTLNYDMSLEASQPIYSFKEFLKLYEMGYEERKKMYIEETYLALKRFLPDMTREELDRMIKTKEIPDKYKNITKWLRDNLEYSIDLSHVDTSLLRHFKNSEDILHKIDPNITIDNFSYYLDNPEIKKLCDLSHQYDEVADLYNKRMQKYDSYRKESQINESIRNSLRDKYYILLMEENIDLLIPEEVKVFEELKKDPKKTYILPGRMKQLFGYGIKSCHAFDSFTEEMDEELNNPNTKSWRLETIKKNRIDYFKTCGIDYHRDAIDINDEYNLLINSPEAKRLWPKKEQVKKFIESRQRLLNRYNIEYYEQQPTFIEMRKEIDELGLLDKDDPINASLYTGSQDKTMVCPNIVKTKNGYDLLSLIMINCNHNDGIIDHNIVHELNHQFELFLKSVEDNKYIGVCGWDILEGTINQQEKVEIDTLSNDSEKRKYELMNEIVNELIAQDICKILHDRGQYVFDTEEKSKYTHTTSYEETFYIIKDFYNEFKNEILESRRNGNIEIIWNKVGKENFDALNELFNIHYEHFSGLRYMSLVNDIREHKETSRTKVFNEIKEKRDKILEQMHKHSMQMEQQEKDQGKKRKKHGVQK